MSKNAGILALIYYVFNFKVEILCGDYNYFSLSAKSKYPATHPAMEL